MIVVESVGVLVDCYEFLVFEKFYVDEVFIDYLSFNGEVLEIKSL